MCFRIYITDHYYTTAAYLKLIILHKKAPQRYEWSEEIPATLSFKDFVRISSREYYHYYCNKLS
jgi:hypothetical protein